MAETILRDKSIVPALDITSLEDLEKIVKATADVETVGGYKVGFLLGLRFGLPRVVDTIKSITKKAVIYDHQKAATDIPDMGEEFASVMKDAKVDTAILFPQAGPATETAWIKALQGKGVNVMVGGIMTHPDYLDTQNGWINSTRIWRAYELAAEMGVTEFVVPGNQPDIVAQVRQMLVNKGVAKPILYAPGFVAQGGKITDSAKAAGPNFHAIVGRGIVKAPDIRAAAIEHGSQL